MDREQESQLQNELKALDALIKLRREIEKWHGIYKGDLLSGIRAERDHEIEEVWRSV